MSPEPKRGTIALWGLPLLAGLLPLLATVIAFNLSVAQGYFATCNPFIDGCVSISRAAREGLGNILFRALLLPAATLQAIVWLLSGSWLRQLGAPHDRLLRVLPWIGVTAAVFLMLYGTFLGTEGEGYRLMRRYGINVYFGFTCIAMLIVAGALRTASRVRRELSHSALLVYALVAALPLLGIINTMRTLYLNSEAAQYAVGNITEWWGGLMFTVFFVVVAWLWWRTRFDAALRASIV
ncbi:MAG TPA: hypothetical protein VIS73_10650 [Rhodocyclaceae bacterium]